MERWKYVGSMAYVMDRGCIADVYYGESTDDARDYAERMNA